VKRAIMGVIGKYIYGVINSIPHLSTEENLLETKRCTANGVYTISYQDISAVVTDSEIVDYTHMLKDASAKQLITHQRVIERIMLDHTIIPMRLGTFAVDVDEVRHFLAKGYPIIKDIFKKVFDKIEIDVAATWSDFNSVVKEVGEEKEIKEFKERLLANPKGTTVDDQMKVGAMVKSLLDKKREEYAVEIETSLNKVREDIKIHDLMDDTMVINAAFLINRLQEGNFDKEIEALNNGFAEKLNFRCVGPLPPYSFYTLEIKKMQFDEIDWARNKLGILNDFTTKDAIKKAFQVRATSSHPDKNPEIPGMEREFDEVTKAYRILWEYCQEDSCSLNEDEFEKNAILVKVRR
jgi:hypothetical protein